MLESVLIAHVEDHLKRKIVTSERVFGGDINSTAKITLEDGLMCFLKWNDDTPKNMFAAEAKGLELLRNAGTDLIIPGVYAFDDNWLLIDYIQERRGEERSSYNLGKALAEMHKVSSSSFGLDHPNFIGRLPQSNSSKTTWPEFYFSERIEAQVKMLIDQKRIESSYLLSINKLELRIEQLYPTEPPALLHGDLWSGNYFFTEGGKTCIYDPAVYFGHREMDLAMSRLFGGFSSDFYQGYDDTYPIEKGFEERLALSQLYPILVHANLFGGHYIQQSIKIIQKYL